MAIEIPYKFQNLDTSQMEDAKDSSGDKIGKVVPASYLDANFTALANAIEEQLGKTLANAIEEQLGKTIVVSGTAPSDATAGLLWYDAINDILKVRNIANNAWYSQMHGDSGQKIWVYRNDTMAGWVIDSSVADVVLSIKGGSQAYNTSGGVVAGTWQQAGHALTIAEMPSHNHTSPPHRHFKYYGKGSSGDAETVSLTQYDARSKIYTDSVSVTIDYTGGGQAHNHGSTWRPAAAVGTLQYPK